LFLCKFKNKHVFNMNENIILRQVSAIFSIFMVLFYIGVGAYFIFYFDQSYIDRAVRVIIGSTFLFYGLFRAFKTFIQIKNLFFSKKTDNDYE